MERGMGMGKIAVVLSGCGQMDGSEIHETLMTLLALSEENLDWMGFAPDISQDLVINHFTGKPQNSPSAQPRNVLEESARLMRGKIAPLSELIQKLRKNSPESNKEFDGIIIPGGYGAVMNLCDFKNKGFDFDFNAEVHQTLLLAKAQKLPVGFICIAPVMIPKIYPGARLTIGNDPELASKIEALGCTHQICSGTEITVDLENKIVSTPANMVGPTLSELYQGIHNLVKAIKKLTEKV